MLDKMDKMHEDRSETRNLPQVRAADVDNSTSAQKAEWVVVLAASSLS